jgi:tight adherence protein B
MNSETWVPLTVGLCAFGTLLALGRGRAAERIESLAALIGGERPGRRVSAILRLPSGRSFAFSAGLTLVGGLLGLRLAGPIGTVAGGGVGASVPFFLRRRHDRGRVEALERQLAELVETVALGVRGGLSIQQSVELAAGESEPPMEGLLRRVKAEVDLGTSFETAMDHFQRDLASDDGRLFGLVIGIHARSGGNLTGALEEVATTIRHRIGVRRELRALSAQGRISGAILGSLPVAFFLVLGATSHRELAPVYRSGLGMAMVGAGLTLQAIAYVWIRRLLRVEV